MKLSNNNIYFSLILIAITLYGCEKEFEVADSDGNIYRSVKIGKQYWLTENLKTTRYRNGDLIGTTAPELNIVAEDTPEYQWAYGGDENNAEVYGRLYTWFVINDKRGICPTGWHVPDMAEWTYLENKLGGSEVAGGKLKEAGTVHWANPNSGATNSSGFTAMPGGWRSEIGVFIDIRYNATFYLSSYYYKQIPGQYIDYHPDCMEVYSGTNIVGIANSGKSGCSVRCIKD